MGGMDSEGAPSPGADNNQMLESAADAKQAIRAAQASADAALHSKFEEGRFDYTESVDASRNMTLGPDAAQHTDPAAGVSVLAYLQRMQRGGLIQSFGCMMLLEEGTFNVLAYSENAPQMLQAAAPKPKDEGATSPGTASPRADDSPRGEGHKSKNPVGAALRSLSHKIHHAIATNRSKQQGRSKNPKAPADISTAATATAASAPASPDRSPAPSPSLERVGSGSRWNPFKRTSASANTSPRQSPPGTPKGGESAPPLPLSADAPPPSKREQPTVGFGVSGLALFTDDSAQAIRKVSRAKDVAMMNPVLVQTVGNGDAGTEKSFYAIFHRTPDGLHVDLEPIRPQDPVFTGEGALQAHKLATRSINKLQRVPTGHLRDLCDTVAQEVRELTGYDRIMVYQFHEDEHGEVLAEARKDTMEPYLGLHYPATDIPQAARFLFMKNRVRIIADATSTNVRVVCDESKLKQQVVLSNSTLRAVHGCHAQYMQNMGTLGSIGMAIVVNDLDNREEKGKGGDRGMKLWGLVVCHHEEARYLPYPLRLACEFLMQVFSMKVNMEIEMGLQEKEKQMLRTQTLLCDMLQRDAPVGIMTQYPNITDLVKCDGAALIYGGRFWTLGSTPTHGQMRDIVAWLQQEHGESSGFSTDSLKDSGYPAAESLSENVCGMIAAQLLGSDYLLWFRCHVEKEVVWHGAKHQPGERDDGSKMNPRSSFQAFLEVVKHRSVPWDDIDIDAVSSLVLILRGHLTSFNANDIRAMEVARLAERDVERMSIAESELSRILQTAVAPVFTVDKQGCITAWNSRMTKLTGLTAGEALGMSLLEEIVRRDCQEDAGRALFCALHGEEAKNIEIRLRTFGPLRPRGGSMSPGPAKGVADGEVVLVVNAFVSRGGLLEDEDCEPGVERKGAVSGVCFVGQDLTAQKAVEGHFTKAQGDYAAIVHSGSSLIPPIFALDEHGRCAEWNPAMEALTGLKREEVLGELILGGVFGTLLRMKSDVRTKLMIVLNRGVSGQNTERYPLAFLNRNGQLVEALLTVNARREGKSRNGEGQVMGAFCFLHTASPELQATLKLQRAAEEFAEAKAKTVAYVRQEMKGPIDGVKYVRSRMESFPHLGDTEKKVLEIGVRCEQQLARVLGDENIENLEEGYLGLEADEYRLDSVVEAVVSMGKQACAQAGLEFRCEFTEDITQKPLLCGDAMRLQQALSSMVSCAAQFTEKGGWVELRVVTGGRAFFVDPNCLRIEFRVRHSGTAGVPVPIVAQMLDTCGDKAQMTQEGLGLAVARKIIQAMDGDVQYDRVQNGRDPNHCAFVVRMPLPYPREPSTCNTPLATSPGRCPAVQEDMALDSSLEILAN